MEQMHFRTDRVAPAQRFESWRQTLFDTYYRLDCSADDARMPLAAKFDRCVTHIDRDGLAASAAQSPDLGCRQSRCGDAGLRQGADAER